LPGRAARAVADVRTAREASLTRSMATAALLAALVACVAPAHPAREGTVEVPGGRVWYQVWGADRPGVPLLVLHGGPGVPHDYLLPLAALADERPVIFYDQLGCGRSERPGDPALWNVPRFVEELACVRAALHLDEVHLFGHSWGSMLGTDYLLTRQPAGIASITFAGPALSMGRWSGDARVLLERMPPDVQQAVSHAEASASFDSPEYQAAIAAYFARHVCRVDPWPEFVQRALSPELMGTDVYLSMGGPSEFTLTGSLRDYERVDRLHEIRVPALFICGEFDEATPDTTRAYHEALPGSELAVIGGASHLGWVEQPESYLRVLRDFLQRAERRPRSAASAPP